MNYKNISNFLAGLFENEQEKARVKDNFVSKLINCDISDTGIIKRRSGYDYWFDLKDENSQTSTLNIPDTLNKTGFQTKVQSLYSYVDVGDNNYLIAVANGKIFLEYDNDNKRQWLCLNPSGDIDLEEKDRHIDITKYLDIVFFNDYENNVFIYNNYWYTGEGYISISYKYIYLSGRRVFFRDYTDSEALYHEHDIVDVSTVDDKFFISGNYTHNFQVDDEIIVSGSTGNDGTYTVKSIAYDSGDNETDIETNESITDGTADGKIKTVYRIFIEDNANNLEGKPIYDGLVEAGYISASGGVITSVSDLKLGFSLRIGNDVDGYNIYALDNQKNQRSESPAKIYLLKFNERIILQDYISLNLNTSGEVIGFDGNENFIYIFSDDGEINKINTNTLLNTIINSNEISNTVAPIASDSKKKYSIGIDTDDRLFLYSTYFPEDNTNLYARDPEIGWNCETFSTGKEWGFHKYKLTIDNNYLYCAGYLVTPTTAKSRLRKYYLSDFSYITELDFGEYSELNIGEIIKQGSYLYLCCSVENKVYKIDIAMFTKYDNVSVGNKPTKIIYDEIDSLWVINQDSNSVSRINISSFSVTATISLPDTPKALGAGNSPYRIYVGLDNGDIKEIDRTSNTITDTIDTGLDTINDIAMPSIIVTGHIGGVGYYADLTFYATIPTKVDLSQTDNGDIPYEILDADYVQQFSARSNSIISMDRGGRNEEKAFRFFNSGAQCTDFFYDSSNNYLYFCFKEYGYLFKFTFPEVNKTYLIGFDSNGNLLDNDFNHYFMLKDTDAVGNFSPITILNDRIYFGNSILNGTSDEGRWCNVKKEHPASGVVAVDADEVSKGMIVQSDPNERFLLKGVGENNYFRVSSNYKWSDGFIAEENYFDFDSYLSSLFYFVHNQINEFQSVAENDLIKYLGAPKKLDVILLNHSSASEFVAGDTFRYFMSYKLYSGLTTYLSRVSDEVLISNIFSLQTFTTDYSTDINNIDCTGHGYVDDDLVRVKSDGTLPPNLSEDTNYYVVKNDNDNFELSNEPAGADIIDLGGDGSGTHYVIKVSGQKLKIKISGIDLKNEADIFMYDIDDVEEIWIYRSKKTFGENNFSDPIFVNNIIKTGGSFDYSPYDDGEWEDTSDSYSYNPFTVGNALKYKVKDLIVHKNRIILINSSNYENRNILQYSNIDMVDALPETNIRAVESGDGDILISAVSVQDYLYLFKTRKIYAILGDVFDGQLIDISKNIGTEYKNLIAEYNGVIYFMNENGIFVLQQNTVRRILPAVLKNYFDKYRNDCIDFENIKINSFSFVNKSTHEIFFFVPQKINGQSQVQNNLVVIYNTISNNFKTYQYYHNMFCAEYAKDILTEDFKILLSDYSGNVYEVTKDKTDYNKAIKWIFQTQYINLGLSTAKKHFRLVRIFGKFLDFIRINYWIDGKKQIGTVSERSSFTGEDEHIARIWNGKRAREIAIEISGENINNPPEEIKEITIGYDIIRSL